jgi:hypothetical protein
VLGFVVVSCSCVDPSPHEQLFLVCASVLTTATVNASVLSDSATD